MHDHCSLKMSIEKKLSSNFYKYLHFLRNECSSLSCFQKSMRRPSVQSFIDSFLLKYKKLVYYKHCDRMVVRNQRQQQLRGTYPSQLLLSYSTFYLKQPKGVGRSFQALVYSRTASLSLATYLEENWLLGSLQDCVIWIFLLSESFYMDSILPLLRLFFSFSVPYALLKWSRNCAFSFSPLTSIKQGLRPLIFSLDFL